MPMVRAYINPSFHQRFMNASSGMTALQLLRIACEEIIPAGLDSEMGHLTPGSIEFIPTVVSEGLAQDVVVDIEAYYYDDRFETIEQRAENMKNAFNTIFTFTTFAVFPKLVDAGWSSDTDDPKFDGDMSMKAAIERYKVRTGHGVLVDMS